jgi:hypothetical protein
VLALLRELVPDEALLQKLLARAGDPARLACWLRAQDSPVELAEYLGRVTSPTKPSRQPDPNAKPGGTPTDASTGSPKQREGHRIENDSAAILARAGYKISQNTGEKGVSGVSEPDYNMGEAVELLRAEQHQAGQCPQRAS